MQKRKRSQEKGGGGAYFSFLLRSAGEYRRAQPAMKPRHRAAEMRRLIRREAAERVLEEGESIGELLIIPKAGSGHQRRARGYMACWVRS